MSWLKRASNIDWKGISKSVFSSMDQLINPGMRSVDVQALLDFVTNMVEDQLSAKEATIVDFPSFNRDDENKGDSGCFDENAPVDRKPKIAPDPGPASMNPGQPGANSPQVFQ